MGNGLAWGSSKVQQHEYDGSATVAQTVVAATSQGMFVPCRVLFTTKDANVGRIYHTSDAVGNRIVSGNFGAGGGVAWAYDIETSPRVPAGQDLMVICPGSCTALVEGIYVPTSTDAAV